MKQSKIRIWLLIAISALLLFISIQYIILSVVSVRRVFVAANSAEIGTQIDLNTKDSLWLELYKQRNWLESRLKMAKSDSIYLSVNLQDSTLQLEIKGVVLKTSSIAELSYDSFFDALPAKAYHHYFGQEATGIQSFASIDKVPLTIKKAPKDSIEFAAQSQITDTLETREVNWLMKLDNGILLKISGINEEQVHKNGKGSFWRKQKLQLVLNNLSKTLQFDVPEYNPSIEILVNEADAKAIFRAIPEQPMVCIRM